MPPRGFYPEIQPYRNGRLRVSDVHEIYWEECGNPAGKCAVVLHGGPGGGISPFLKRLHEPKHYRIILFDQRGCGQSTPYGSLEHNTTQHLVADIELLRKHLGIATWQVLGGSWGSTLALTYAEAYPQFVDELIVRGIFLGTPEEIRWFYQEGANWLFPDVWERFAAPIPNEERFDLVSAHHRRLTGSNEAEMLASARAWSQWEAATMSLLPDPQRVEKFGEDQFAVAFGRIESHYFVNRCFLAPHEILSKAERIRHLPGVIIHGRYDVVTPLRSAFALHNAWPEAQFVVVDGAGHTATEPGIAAALVRATSKFLPQS